MTGKWVEFTDVVGSKVSLQIKDIIGFEEGQIGEHPAAKCCLKPGDPYTIIYTNPSWFDVTATYAEVKQAIEEN